MQAQSKKSLTFWQEFILAILRSVLFLHTLASRLLQQGLGPAKSITRGKRPGFPKVIALILLEDQEPSPNEPPIAQLVCRAYRAGIETVQVYHTFPWSKESKQVLENLIGQFAQPCRILSGFKKGAEHIVDSDLGGSPHTLVLLDSSDAKTAIDKAEKFCQKTIRNLEQEREEASSQDLYQALEIANGVFAVQEPSIIVIFGEHLFLAGFPPWLVRHSEIYLAKDLASSEGDIIEQALQRYLHTKQRFGT